MVDWVYLIGDQNAQEPDTLDRPAGSTRYEAGTGLDMEN
jgi:hypothetical protein